MQKPEHEFPQKASRQRGWWELRTEAISCVLPCALGARMPLSVTPSSLSSPCQERCHHGPESNSKEAVESQPSSPATTVPVQTNDLPSSLPLFGPQNYRPFSSATRSCHQLEASVQLLSKFTWPCVVWSCLHLRLLPQRNLLLPYQVPQKNSKSAKSRLINILQGPVQKVPLWVVRHSKMVPPRSVLPYPTAHPPWKALDTSED